MAKVLIVGVSGITYKDKKTGDIRSRTFPGVAAAMAFQFTNNFFVL